MLSALNSPKSGSRRSSFQQYLQLHGRRHTRPRHAARAHRPTRHPRCVMSSGRACVQILFLTWLLALAGTHLSLSLFSPLHLGVSRPKEQHPERCPRERVWQVVRSPSAEPRSSSAADQRAAAMLPVARARDEFRPLAAQVVAAAWAMAESRAGAAAWARAAARARARPARRRRP